MFYFIFLCYICFLVKVIKMLFGLLTEVFSLLGIVVFKDLGLVVH